MQVSSWLVLIRAIGLEVAGIAFMRTSDGLTKPLHTAAAAIFYLTSVGLIVVAAESIGIGVTYAVWSGLGTAAVAALGVLAFNEKLSVPRALSIAAIILGVVGLKLLTPHPPIEPVAFDAQSAQAADGSALPAEASAPRH
jgi:small multidrug resistance pump